MEAALPHPLGVSFIPRLIVKLVPMRGMNKDVIAEPRSIDKNKNHPTLEVIVMPDFVRQALRRAGKPLDFIERSIDDVHASPVGLPPLPQSVRKILARILQA